jgi:hypothetical protein
MAVQDDYVSMSAASAQKFNKRLRAGDVAGTWDDDADVLDKAPILIYPSDIGVNDRQASYILFTGYAISKAKVKPRKKGLKVTFAQAAAKKTADEHQDEVRARQKIMQDESNAKANAGPGGSALTLSRRNIPQSGTVIGLYMPPSVTVSYSMGYEDAPIGAMSEALYGIIKDIQGGKSAFDAVGSSAGVVGSALKQMGAKTIDAILPGAKDLIAIERGVITAPRTELMFQGIGRREFSFTFTFIPKDHQESKTVHAIVQKFKEGMTPSFALASTTRELTIPDVFQIDYMHITGRNSYLNKIGRCYLTKMDVTYGGDKFVTYNDAGDAKGPPPQKTSITLAFKELEIMDRAKVEAGF